MAASSSRAELRFRHPSILPAPGAKSMNLTVPATRDRSLAFRAMEVREAARDEHAEAGRVTAEAYREFIRPGETAGSAISRGSPTWRLAPIERRSWSRSRTDVSWGR